jgi:hypothetical protein
MKQDIYKVDKIKGFLTGDFELYSQDEMLASIFHKGIFSSTMLFEISSDKYSLKRKSFWTYDYVAYKGESKVAELISDNSYSRSINILNSDGVYEKFKLKTDGKWFFKRFILTDSNDKEVFIFNLFRETWLSDLDYILEERHIDQVRVNKYELIIYAAFCCYKIYDELHSSDSS